MPWRVPASGAPRSRKLTVQQVVAIRHRWAKGGVEQLQLAAEYRVTPNLVGMIVRGKVWKHAPGPIVPAGHRSGVPHIKVRLPAEVGPCVGCGRVMVRHRDWREAPELWRARGGVHCAGKGRCVSCATKANRAVPARGKVRIPSAPVRAVRAKREPAKAPQRHRPRPAPLSPAELARLRALVGLPAVLPSERAS